MKLSASVSASVKSGMEAIHPAKLLRRLVRPARLERATFWFVAKRSIQLSYGRKIEEWEYCHLNGRLSTIAGDICYTRVQ